jgi:anti-sigma B factor antagonist
MSLEIALRDREGVSIFDLNGRITMGAEVSAFRDACEKAALPGARMILNMRDVDYIDSTGLGALVMCSTRLRKVDGAVKLLNVNRRNIELIVMTKIDTIFEIFDDETDAVNSFFPGRAIKRFDLLSFVRKMQDE